MTASSSRPPAHHPTRQHAASAGRSFPHPRSDGAGVAASSISALQTPGVGKQREIAGALDRGAQLTLMPRAHAAQAARQDLAVIGDEAAEGALVLVVDEAHAALAEGAGLGWASHRLLLVLVVFFRALFGERKLFLGHRRSA